MNASKLSATGNGVMKLRAIIRQEVSGLRKTANIFSPDTIKDAEHCPTNFPCLSVTENFNRRRWRKAVALCGFRRGGILGESLTRERHDRRECYD